MQTAITVAHDLDFFVRGLIIGLSIAAPVGPMAVLCIRRALDFGMHFGVASGAGVALADGFYASVAAFGLNAVSNTLFDVQTEIRLIGGLVLAWLGLRLLRSARDFQGTTQIPLAGASGAMTLATTFTLTLANPMTILSFTAIFAGLGLSLDSDRASSALLVAGVFAGSMLWWVLLTGGVTLLRRRLDERWIRRINTASALVILMFATISVGSVIF